MHTDRKEDEDDQLGQPFTSQSGYDRTPQQELAESEITLRKVESERSNYTESNTLRKVESERSNYTESNTLRKVESERSNYTESNASSLSVVVGHKPKQS